MYGERLKSYSNIPFRMSFIITDSYIYIYKDSYDNGDEFEMMIAETQ